MQIFISHSTKDQSAAEAIVEKLRLHYLNTWYAPRTIGAGYFEPQIREGLELCHWFVVLLSPAALSSDWVQREVQLAMEMPHLKGKVLPVLMEPCDWKTMHPDIGRLQAFDLVADAEEAWHRLLHETFKVAPHEHDYYRVGDVKVQVFIAVGGDGELRLGPGDIIGDAPAEEYVLPDELAVTADEDLRRMEVEARRRGRTLVNNRQVRLRGASWGSAGPSGMGIETKPLRLDVGWTRYYFTKLTNMDTDREMSDGYSLGQKYAGPLDSFVDSRLSNPLAVNLSVITRDNFIYFGRRGNAVAWNAGGYQPAVSGDGQPEDLNSDGSYDPFATAIREAMEECTGRFRPNAEDVTFFGLARTMKTRFSFLFGELRVDLTSRQLKSFTPLTTWEGRRACLPFTVEAVTDWIAARYRDQVQGRLTGAVGTTLFALLQSLHYGYPDRWPEIVDRLSNGDDGDSHSRTRSPQTCV